MTPLRNEVTPNQEANIGSDRKLITEEGKADDLKPKVSKSESIFPPIASPKYQQQDHVEDAVNQSKCDNTITPMYNKDAIEVVEDNGSSDPSQQTKKDPQDLEKNTG